MDFRRFCRFHDDLIQVTQLTLPTVKQLRLCDLQIYNEDYSFPHLFRLIPNLEHLTIDAEKLSVVLDAVRCQHQRFHSVQQLIVIETAPHRLANRDMVTQEFPNASVVYRKRS